MFLLSGIPTPLIWSSGGREGELLLRTGALRVARLFALSDHGVGSPELGRRSSGEEGRERLLASHSNTLSFVGRKEEAAELFRESERKGVARLSFLAPL